MSFRAGWPRTTLRQAGVTLIDCDHRTPVDRGEGYPYIAIPQLHDGHIRLDGSARRISPDDFVEWTKKLKPQADDVIVVRRCSSGDSAVVPPNFECAIGQNLVVLRADGKFVYPPFLRWLVRSDAWWEQVKKYINVGAVFDSLKCREIPNFELPIPPLALQKEIASTLNAIDDRITLLRETNASLEAIAQALFKSWFVDFDPVRANMEGRVPDGMDEATAALFPDGFEESALGLVPRGWRVGKVSDLAEIKGGKQLEKTDFSDEGPNPVFGGAGVMGHTKLTNATGLVITVGRVGAYCGQFFWHFGDAWVNNNASRIVPSFSSDGLWLYQWLRQADIEKIKKGAAQPFVSNGDIAEMQLLIPTTEAMQSFTSIADSVYARLHLNKSKAQTLATLRDTLLPRLISGQLRLPEAEALAA